MHCFHFVLAHPNNTVLDLKSSVTCYLDLIWPRRKITFKIEGNLKVNVYQWR